MTNIAKNSGEENLLPDKDIAFSDDEGRIYPVYFALSHIRLSTVWTGFAKKTLYLGTKAFPVSSYLSCFSHDRKGVYLDLASLLGFQDVSGHLASQVLTLVLKDREGKEEETRLVYLSRYSLLKDPRKKENQGHISLLLDTLTLDFPYQRTGNRSNLKVKIDSQPLYFLLADSKA